MPRTIHQIIAKAEEECIKSGQRLTDKRKNILMLMLNAGIPLSAYDIADLYRERYGDTLAAMSVYRMLNFLLEVKLAHKLETTNQYVACSHIACEHEHEVPQFLICDKCHSVKEVGVKKKVMEELKDSIEKTGFSMSNQQLELHGLCANCRASAKVESKFHC